nr:hypothetical protein CFP56_42330 [Quercus suber]
MIASSLIKPNDQVNNLMSFQIQGTLVFMPFVRSEREKRALVVFSAMDSSQMFGGTEECQSSESGWTMYIGSPIYGDDDSDDSMASDASSRPSHAYGSANKKEEKYCFDKKAKEQQQEKQKAQKMKEEKDQKMFSAKKAEAPSQSSAKVRKNIWMGKRK